MSGTPSYAKLCHISELKERTGKRFFINDTDIAVFKIEGRIYAVSNICPHQKSALIYEGTIEGAMLFARFTVGNSILKTERKITAEMDLKLIK